MGELKSFTPRKAGLWVESSLSFLVDGFYRLMTFLAGVFFSKGH